MGDVTRTTPSQRSPKTEDCRSRLVSSYRPCVRCGEARHRRSDSGLCRPCYWIKRREGSPLTGLTQAEYDAARYDPSKRRDNYLRNKFGISLAEYEVLLQGQGGRCAICRDLPSGAAVERSRSFTNGGLVVDHCHQTGRVRGLLCDLCNKGLGQFKDDPARVRAALSYLAS